MYLTLHSPGCGVAGELCSPHPMGVADTIRYAIENPEMLLAPLLLVAIAWLIVSPVKQYANNEDCEVEG